VQVSAVDGPPWQADQTRRNMVQLAGRDGRRTDRRLAVAVPGGTATLSANSAPTSPRHAHPGSPSPGGLLSPLAPSRLIATVDQDHPPGRPVDVGSVALGDPVWLEPQDVVHGQERIPGLGYNSRVRYWSPRRNSAGEHGLRGRPMTSMAAEAIPFGVVMPWRA
jgi:hypothetical protein